MTILRRWTRPGPGAEYQPLTPKEKEDIRRIEQAVMINDQTCLAEYGGLTGCSGLRWSCQDIL